MMWRLSSIKIAARTPTTVVHQMDEVMCTREMRYSPRKKSVNMVDSFCALKMGEPYQYTQSMEAPSPEEVQSARDS